MLWPCSRVSGSRFVRTGLRPGCRPQYAASWPAFLNQYYWLQYYVDQQVGAVLNALDASPYAANTVVIFVSDHGQYGGAHGLHDKAGAVYEESLRVPLYVRFPGRSGAISMNQMCSSVDFFGLMFDLATSGPF